MPTPIRVEKREDGHISLWIADEVEARMLPVDARELGRLLITAGSEGVYGKSSEPYAATSRRTILRRDSDGL